MAIVGIVGLIFLFILSFRLKEDISYIDDNNEDKIDNEITNLFV